MVSSDCNTNFSRCNNSRVILIPSKAFNATKIIFESFASKRAIASSLFFMHFMYLVAAEKHSSSNSFSETVPYTDYDWNGNVDMDEWIASTFTEYNYIKIIYDDVERPAINKVNGKFRVEIYVDGGYAVMSGVYSGTRY